jgi:hypothetical protein
VNKLVGGIECTWCEGTGVAAELTTPHMEKFVLPCPQEKLQDRFTEVLLDLDRRVSRDTIRLRKYISTMFTSSTYVGVPCPQCNQTGYELRLVQTGPPERDAT